MSVIANLKTSLFNNGNKVHAIEQRSFPDTDEGFKERQIYMVEQKKKKMTAADLIDEQASGQAVPGSIWKAVVDDDRELITELMETEPRTLFMRDPVGATPMLLAYLMGNFELGQWLIDLRPEIISDTYTPSELYEGENALHIAVVNRSMTAVQFLVKRCPALLNGRARGSFFTQEKRGEPEKHCYFGEFPLSFACAAGRKQIVEYLVAHGANPYQQDSNGNTCLHITILKGSTEMAGVVDDIDRYIQHRLGGEPAVLRTATDGTPRPRHDFPIKEEWGVSTEKAASIWTVRNNTGLTPFCLAAYHGSPDMFAFLVNRRVIRLWAYGPVCCNAYALDEMDELLVRLNRLENQEGRNDKKKEMSNKSAMEIIVQNQHMELMNTKKVVGLLDRKWNGFAKKRLYRKIKQIVCYLLVFTMSILMRSSMRNGGDWLSQYDTTTKPVEWIVIQSIFEVLSIIGASYKMVVELKELFFNGFHRQFSSAVGFARAENVISAVFCLSFFVSLGCRMFSAYSVERVLVTVMACCLWLYLFFLFMAFQTFGPFIVMIFRILFDDVARFAVLVFFMIMAFATSFFILDDHDENNMGERLGDFGIILRDLYYQMLSQEVQFERMGDDSLPEFKYIIYLYLFLFSIMACVMFLNLLIAMMGNTYDSINKSAETQWRLVFAQIIFSIEDEMSPQELRKIANGHTSEKYWVEIKGHKYLSVEEPNPVWKHGADGLDGWLAAFDTNEDNHLEAAEVKELMKAYDKMKRTRTHRDDEGRPMTAEKRANAAARTMTLSQQFPDIPEENTELKSETPSHRVSLELAPMLLSPK